MGRIEKTVFVSYRRRDEPWALAVFGDLTRHGYDVFIDYDGIASGSFESIIFQNIRARAHFLVLLTPSALERSGDPNDWMRREIEAAPDSKRNIVPLMLAGFKFGTPAATNQLTGNLAALKDYNGLPIPEGFFAEAMERLRSRYLTVPVDAVLHPASDSALQAAREQKDKATVALGDERHKLTEPRRVELKPTEDKSKQPLSSIGNLSETAPKKEGRTGGFIVLFMMLIAGGIGLYSQVIQTVMTHNPIIAWGSVGIIVIALLGTIGMFLDNSKK